MLTSDVTINGGKTATAYNRVLEDIVSGRRPPGSSIDREAVALDLGISVQPVTTAIDQLAADGFADIRLQKGSFVAPIRLSRMIEASFVISALLRASFRYVMADRGGATMPALEVAIAAIAAEGERADFMGLIGAIRVYRDTTIEACHVALARAEAAHAGAYLQWSVDQFLTVHPPETQTPEVIRELCGRMAGQYIDLHKALISRNAMRHATQAATVYATSRTAFQQMAVLHPAVIQP